MSKTNRLTVGALRKVIKDLPANMPIYTVDHDHSDWETNGWALNAEVRDQSKMNKYAKQKIKEEIYWKIEGEYLAIFV